MNTFSPTPAPTESSATSVRPVASPEAASGWSTSIFSPVRFGSFMVETTSPSTRASCTLVLDLDGVDDADDGGVDGVDGDEVGPFGFAAGIDRTRDQQLAADQTLVLPRRDDGPYDL